MEQREYVRCLLDAYRATPGTSVVDRRADCLFYSSTPWTRVPLEAVEDVLIFAAARRLSCRMCPAVRRYSLAGTLLAGQ
jgi:hypothetical protein